MHTAIYLEEKIVDIPLLTENVFSQKNTKYMTLVMISFGRYLNDRVFTMPLLCSFKVHIINYISAEFPFPPAVFTPKFGNSS